MDSQTRQLLNSERKRLAKERKEMFSLWCTELYRLSIANKVFTTKWRAREEGRGTLGVT